MTIRQLIEILQQYPSDLEVVLANTFGTKPTIESCSRVDKRTIIYNGYSQEYVFLSQARLFECLEPIGASKGVNHGRGKETGA